MFQLMSCDSVTTEQSVFPMFDKRKEGRREGEGEGKGAAVPGWCFSEQVRKTEV
jgi:hypothetical protein